ncbi:tRNA adenosine(34) deaminase TadA [Lapidilactobacillus bayanensis]|uniref:tRNA adenosine(34) deaminase TadA n=1 Tax=Lapidilactobacillus bayanensis TaxID=2485998 RepID=UPI0021F07331|nr:tRNA adenosine(34) deaminase TadA [Lapidilactobacillus bayanensis]
MATLAALTSAQKKEYMDQALQQAQLAGNIGEVPIGAVIERDGQIIARAYNLRETSQDATDHAELMAIKKACQAVGSWRLERARLFVTLEPCPMCAGAIINSRIAEVYYAASDPKAGAAGSLVDLLSDKRFNHQPRVFAHINETESKQMLQDFFRQIRASQKARKKLKK